MDEFKCKKCSTSEHSFVDGYCIDCWPGYNICKNEACRHYRCEHGDTSCWNADCPCQGFEEGSSDRVVTVAEFEAIKKSWKAADNG